MKKYLFIIIALCFSAHTMAQDNGVTEFQVNGINVIHKHSPKQVVSAKVFFKGGTSNYTKETEGIEALALSWVSQAGTANYPKDAFNAQLEKTGSSISSSTNYDYSTISLRCLNKYWADSWNILSDVICNPSYDETEFNNLKGQMTSNAQQAESDPDTHLRNSAMGNVFEGKPYSRIPEGSPASLEKLTKQQVSEYFESVRNTARMFIVVVGDISPKQLKAQIATLECVPEVAIRPTRFPATDISSSAYNGEEREIATNYVRGMVNAPNIGSEDEMAMRVAISIYKDRLWQEIRTERNLSYAPGAYFPSSILKDPYCLLYVSTDKPNEAVQVMLDEIQKVRLTGFSKSELINKKGEFLTQYYMGQETNSSQAETLGKSYITVGIDAGSKQMDKVNSLTIEEINEAFKKYVTNIAWTYLGDTSIVDKDVFLAPIIKKQTTPRNPPGAPTKKKMKEMKKRKMKAAPTKVETERP